MIFIQSYGFKNSRFFIEPIHAHLALETTLISVSSCIGKANYFIIKFVV